MAENIGSLYIRLGLSLSELTSDFIAAEKSISENMSRLAQEQNIIKLRAEIETAGLDKVKDAEKIIEIQMKALNNQIASQKDRLKLAEVGLKSTAEKTGELSAQTQKATQAVEKEKLILVQLEEKLKNLSNQKIQLNTENVTNQFSTMQKTIDACIASLNQKNTLIRLRTEFDTSGLDKAKDAEKILEMQMKSLNQQIRNQKAIINASEKALREISNQTGKFSAQSQQAAINVEKQKIALKRLEEELRNVTNEQKNLSDQQEAVNSNKLLNGYQNLKGDIVGKLNNLNNAFSGLTSATNSADLAITKSLEIIGSIPNPVGKAIAALASVPLIFRGIENSIVETVKAATSSGDAVYVMSRGMQMSVAEMGKLSTVAKVTGIDINEVNSNLRRLAAQFVKSGENGNLMTKTFDKYNVKLTDANGNLKKGLDLSLAVADGLKKAQLAGKGLEFISAVGGRFWSGDFITYLEDLRDNVNASNKIVKNGLANPVLAHTLQGNINAMNTQSAQLKASFESVFMPVANEIVPRITERMGELTKFLSINKTEIKAFGESVAKFFGSIEDGADLAISAIKKVVEAIKTMKISDTQKAVIELNKSMANRIDPQIYQQNLSYRPAP